MGEGLVGMGGGGGSVVEFSFQLELKRSLV